MKMFYGTFKYKLVDLNEKFNDLDDFEHEVA